MPAPKKIKYTHTYLHKQEKVAFATFELSLDNRQQVHSGLAGKLA